MSVRDKWVRRFSIDETAKHKNGFTIYKITSVLFPLDSPEAVTVVSVWKRYSDVQQLHKSMKSLHTGLHLKGSFPQLAKNSFFKRFSPEVIEERSKTIKALLEFVAEHRLLFTSTDFVNFLQTGYPEPDQKPSGLINTIRSSLHLPIEETPPLEYQNSDDEGRNPAHSFFSAQHQTTSPDIDISQIPIHEPTDVEIKESPKTSTKLSESDSFETINSIESLDSDLYEELSKINIDRKVPSVKRNVLPDLINFDAPSTSKFEDYHTMPKNKDIESISISSTVVSKSVPSLSMSKSVSETEDSYVFAAGYALNLAVSCEQKGDYRGAFDCYKLAIEKMLIGVRTDTDQQRKMLVKEKINKYLSYAEAIYKTHLCNVDLSVIQKIPCNLTEFDDYFHQRADETRQPILPTVIPYMVPLQAYVETDDLIFLILSYAPGERLFDYVKNYKQTIPDRQFNLENIFTEPIKNIDIQNDNVGPTTDISLDNKIEGDDVNENLKSIDVVDNVANVDLSVNELVINSQRLLLNVDRVLTEVPNIINISEEESGREVREEKREKVEKETGIVETQSTATQARPELPPSAFCRWAAEILTALESLHNCGIIWRDLHPRNILLGARGQVLLTYCAAYTGSDVTLSKLERSGEKDSLYVAPELFQLGHDQLDRACDFWSFGATLYELICGFPLSHRHGRFTRHTELSLPRALPLDARELLAQLLTYDPSERLGSGKDGIDEIKQHPYFRHIDWQEVYDSWIVPD
ncbi:ribosomal protein S6 kinase delta-1 [Melitaea cinxia]|uniref:ribosomal protein S6 kinase delta-1 n=1 Tax=Melitaea cinxia TaxID=113334 RepID=UPI001E274528|nr:ribosomal protein S6 kinase delta-1 [Melitaea cinxia]